MNDVAIPIPHARTDEELLTAELRRPTHVVGIGASAGGLEALERLFAQMPAQTGVAFVVIQHLSPDFKSLTDELLARRTPIPILQARDGMEIGPDAIYLLPPKKDMILADGKLLLSDKEPAPTVALPIDRFFRSLAQDCGGCAVGVVLSGTGSDGSRGVRDIATAGGLVIAQSADSAKFDGMPNSAVNTGVVHLTLDPEAMPAALMRHIRHPNCEDAIPAAQAEAEAPVGMRAIFRLLRDAYGIDFSHYKAETVARRTERRLAIAHDANIDEYAARVADDPAELNHLYKDLLIGVTEFFRDPDAFARLERDILPTLLAHVAKDEEFRAWVAGCATGEEAYSLAILIHEAVERLGRPLSVKVFATDVHKASLDQAGTGFYSAGALSGVSPERLDRYFTPRDGGYQVAPELRKLIVFAQHNVLRDAPFTKLDLVTCRNLLIYFQSPAQKKALSLFHFGLKTGGVLLLGPSEGTGELADEFDAIDTHWKLYRKRRDVRLPTEVRLPAAPGFAQQRPDTRLAGSPHALPDALLIGDALLDECMPPSLLVNERREVVRAFAGANRFLKVSGGWFSNDVLDLVDDELRMALAGALPRAVKEMRPVAFKGLRTRTGGEERVVNVTVKPFRSPRATLAYTLVRLEELGAAPPAGDSPREAHLGQVSKEQITTLESELRYTKENLQAMIEEMETSNEELQATNEELVASNEELQSTNEELHSVNEELYTVNAEYQKKIAELTEMTADMDNLLASTEVHTVFLDKSLCIRKFTPKIAEAFNLLPQDIGRRIDNFTYTLDHPTLVEDVRRVLDSARPLERQVRDRRGTWFLMRVLPYRKGQAVDGVVLTLVDIDRVLRAERDAGDKGRQLAGILRNSPNWVFVKDIEGRYLLADDAFKRLVACDPLGKTVFDLFPRETAEILTAQHRRVLASEADDVAEIVIPQPDGPHTYLSVMYPIRDESDRIVAVGGVRTDVTPLKRAESQAREAVVQRERFLAVLSHELRNPLAAVRNAARVLGQGGEPAEWLPVIERRARHMARLLDDLLDVARVTQNKIEIRKARFDLATTVRDAVEEVRPWYEDRKLTLDVATPAEPLPVEGDPARLQQAQVNLLMNAAKYSRPGGRVWYAVAAEDGRPTIRVRDEGVGMTAATLAKAFDLFAQGDESLDRPAGGIGVGLTLVRAIVELHGGTVEAHSNGPGRGSEFVVRLSPAPNAERPSAPAAMSTSEISPKCLLLVEDDRDIRESLRTLLKLVGHDVRAVGDGPAALAATAERCPDVALLDIGIPGMSGYELAKELRGRYPALTLVALTGYGREEDRAAARAAGFDAHLTKPFEPEQLSAVLADLSAPSVEFDKKKLSGG